MVDKSPMGGLGVEENNVLDSMYSSNDRECVFLL